MGGGTSLKSPILRVFVRVNFFQKLATLANSIIDVSYRAEINDPVTCLFKTRKIWGGTLSE